MIRTATLIFVAFSAIVPFAAFAQNDGNVDIPAVWEEDRTTFFDAASVDLNDFIWLARPVVIFADTPNDPAFRRQMDLLAEQIEDLAERDVIVVTDTDPSANTALRERLRPRGFSMVLIGKDGEIELRKPSPWDVREISRSIDKMPVRQQEIADRRARP